MAAGSPEKNKYEFTSELSICNSSNKYKTLQNWFETTFAQGKEPKISALDLNNADGINQNDCNPEFEHKDSLLPNEIIAEKVYDRS